MEQAALNKKRGGMEVKGAGLWGWGPKVVGQDRGSEHVSRSWVGSMSLTPAATPVQWGLWVAELYQQVSWAAQSPHRWVGQGDTHSPTTCRWDAAAHAVAQGLPPGPTWPQQKMTPFRIPSPCKGLFHPHPQPGLLPPPHQEQAAYCSEPPFLILAWRRQRKPRRRGGDGCGGWKAMAPAQCPLRASPGYLHME